MISEIKYLVLQKRYKYNLSVEENLAEGYINGQNIGVVSNVRYGLCRMGFNGCESIALYNAMLYLGKKTQLTFIALYMERYKMLMGILGCNPYRISRALTRYGIGYMPKECIDNNGAYIISFWTGRRMMSSIHTVFARAYDDGLEIYNLYNNSPDTHRFSTCSEFIGKGRIILIYQLEK